jgi:hypothetical protein
MFLEMLLKKGYSATEICLILGINISSCLDSIKKHNLSGLVVKNKPISFTPNQIEIVCDEYVKGTNSYLIAKSFGVSSDTVLRLLKVRGIEIRNKNHCDYLHKDYNENAFSEEGEKRDYFFGFLLADGCLTSNLISISVSLKQTDYEIIEKLKQFLRSDNNIRYYDRFDKRTGKTYKSCSFSFSGKPVMDCVSFGFSTRKSLKESVKEKSFLSSNHFWRGVIDGDGHIRLAKNNSSQISLCGSSEIIESFIDFSEKYCGVIFKPKLRKVKTTKNNLFLYSVTFCGENCRKILKVLYKDSITFLARKRDIADKILKEWETKCQ